MTPRTTAAALVLLAVVALAASLPATGQGAPGIPAQVADLDAPVKTRDFSVIDFGRSASRKDDRTGTARWRTIGSTGNCCENYVTIGSDGRLFDFGGSYINFTDNDGKTWKRVAPVAPLVNGEGAVVMAPNGDVLGVEWDPYSGDHLLSFKYDAKTKEWLYLEMPLKTPFYDREWIGVIPGPITINGQRYPYVSFVRGGVVPSKDPWLFSTDGLTYYQISSTAVDQMFTNEAKGWLNPNPKPYLDWIQANTNMGLTPLGPGRALAAPDTANDDWAIFDAGAFQWRAFSLNKGNLDGRFQVDSAGTIHNLEGNPAAPFFQYRTSSDGGRNWKDFLVRLPNGYYIEDLDFRANKAAGVSAVAIYATDRKNDVTLVYKFDISGGTPRLDRLYRVGRGDANATGGLNLNCAPRFDFHTVAIFPDGRVAVTFLDSTTKAATLRCGTLTGPNLAVEQSTRF